MKKWKIVLTAWLLALASAGWVACDSEDGWFEDAGEEIDDVTN